MMKNYILTFTLFCSLLTYSQIKFEKGYFISNSGVQTECYIKNFDWKSNPNKFEYKITLQETTSKKETIANIKEFGIENSCKFIRFKVNIERSENLIRNLTSNKNPVWKEETLLLKVLTKGDATLYSYIESNICKYFFQTKSKPIEQLVQIEYTSNGNDNGNIFNSFSDGVMENNLFRQQLYLNLRCVGITESDFNNLKYDKSELIKIFNKYNSCKGVIVVDYEPNNSKKNIHLKVNLGIDNTSISFNGTQESLYLSTDLEDQIVYKYGAEIEYVLPFNKNKWSIYLNPIYQSFDQEKEYTKDEKYGGVIYPIKLQYSYSNLAIPFGLKHYFFLNSSSKLFVNLGYSFNSISSAKFKFDYANTTKEMYSKSGGNLVFGFGYTFNNKFSAEFRLNTSRDVLRDYLGTSAKQDSYGVLLGYTLF